MLTKSSDMLNKNTWGVKKVRGQEEPATKNHYQKCGHRIVCSIRVFKMDFLVIKLSHCSLSLKYLLSVISKHNGSHSLIEFIAIANRVKIMRCE